MPIKIPLTQGYFAEIDEEDYAKVSKYNWRLLKTGRQVYAITNTPGRNSTIRMHRLIMDEPVNMKVDHKDGNGLNNTKANLRTCSQQQNGRNRISAASHNCTGVLGVSLYKRTGMYEAHLSINRKKIYLGRYKTVDEALAVRVAAEKKYFGEFAPVGAHNAAA